MSVDKKIVDAVTVIDTELANVISAMDAKLKLAVTEQAMRKRIAAANAQKAFKPVKERLLSGYFN